VEGHEVLVGKGSRADAFFCEDALQARRDNICSTVNAKGMLIMAKPLRPITRDDLRGQPGLSRAASNALVAQQPPTVMKALVMHGVGRNPYKPLVSTTITELLISPFSTLPSGILISPSHTRHLRLRLRFQS
jgi:hypothetical protein